MTERHQVVIYVRREDVEAGRIRGYVHPKAMEACKHERRQRMYHRGPKPKQLFVKDGWKCLACGVILND